MRRNEHLKQMSASDWLARMARESAGKLYPEAISTDGVFFDPELIQEQNLRLVSDDDSHPETVEHVYGGFFAPINQENDEAMIQSLLGTDATWFLEARNASGLGAATRGLTAEREAFVKAHHIVHTAFLNFNQGMDQNWNVFTPAASDSTLTDLELYEIFEKLGLESLIREMGELGMPFIELVGGELQAIIDFESEQRRRDYVAHTRYDEQEFAHLPKHVKTQVEELLQRAVKAGQATGVGHIRFDAAIDEMENRCSSNPERIYNNLGYSGRT